MGLDTTHDCWHGPYGAFNRWREQLAKRIDLPLPLMKGFCPWFQAMVPSDGSNIIYGFQKPTRYSPLKWPSSTDEPLVLLLSHSDCDGDIRWQDAEAIANRLDTIIKAAHVMTVPSGSERADYDGFIPACERFSNGLRSAAAAKENVDFC